MAESTERQSYLLTPVLTDEERAVVLMQMSKAAYETWAQLGGLNANYEELSLVEKEKWGRAVGAAVRVMFRLVGDIAD